MKKKATHRLFLALTCLFLFMHPFHSQAQKTNTVFRLVEDSLAVLGKTMLAGIDERAKKEATYKFIPMLVRALKVPGSFDYPFDSVKMMSISVSPDHRFRILNWFINRNNMSYRFYGAIQVNNNGGKLQLFPLLDFSDNILNPEDTITEAKKWYGAQYYTILPPDERGYYVLLGWKGMNNDIKARLVDVLHFEHGKAVFGSPIFKSGKSLKSRLIFRHKTDVTMKLNFLAEKNEIIMDHLSSADSKQDEKYDQYGPDGTYDALVNEGGFWVLKEGVKMQNKESEKDKTFIQPVHAGKSIPANR